MSRSRNINHKISRADLIRCLSIWVRNNAEESNKDKLVENLQALKRRLGEMREKGGYAMVSSDGADITIYKIY